MRSNTRKKGNCVQSIFWMMEMSIIDSLNKADINDINISFLVLIINFGLFNSESPNMNYDKFINILKTQGYTVNEIMQSENETRHTFFSVYQQYCDVNGQRISVYEFPDVSTADSQAKTISKDGFSIGNAMISWIDKPHFYKQGKLIVGYIGSNNELLGSLKKILGEPITK